MRNANQYVTVSRQALGPNYISPARMLFTSDSSVVYTSRDLRSADASDR